jgi:hypothetical protein
MDMKEKCVNEGEWNDWYLSTNLGKNESDKTARTGRIT